MHTTFHLFVQLLLLAVAWVGGASAITSYLIREGALVPGKDSSEDADYWRNLSVATNLAALIGATVMGVL
jgi:hypothetical protein